MTEGKITIRIDEKGELSAETHKILGPQCLDELNSLLEELVSVTDVNKTDEYYMKQTVSTVVKGKVEVKD